MTTARTFLEEYVDVISASLANEYNDNYDHRRFGERPRRKRDWSCKGLLRDLLRRRGYLSTHRVNGSLLAAWRLVASDVDRFEWLFQHLADDQSRALLVRLLAFRALGHRRVKLPLNTPDYWRAVKRTEHLADKDDYIQVSFKDWKLFRTSLEPLGFPLEVYITVNGAHALFGMEHYRCVGHNGPIEAEPGDYVVDGGACWGDTALYFADKVGSQGRVLSLEFVPSNLEVLRTNLELNPRYRDRITLVERALWNASDRRLQFTDGGPGSRLTPDEGSDAHGDTTTVTIDDLVERHDLQPLDFIKMDIEGAELSALRGAVGVLNRFRPKLAISIYHKLSDFLEIPEFIASLDLGYQLYIRHFTIHAEETVLFGQAERP